jgi:hypothetical protein
MMIRILIVILIMLVGAAALTSLNPQADKTTNPILKGLANVRSWFNRSDNIANIPQKTTKVYKWQDKNGAWHFSNQPPPEGVASKVVTYRSDTNVTQAPQAATESTPAQQATKPATATPPADSNIPLLPITDPERVKQLIDDAKNVQQLVNQHQQQIEQQSDAR